MCCALCRQPLSNISGPPVPQSAPPAQVAHAQQTPQQNTQPQQHAAQQQAQPPHQQQQKQQHGAQAQTQQHHRVRREDENSVVVRGTRYTKLECVGRGGSSKVTLPPVTLT